MRYRQLGVVGVVCALAGAGLEGATAKEFFQAIRSNDLAAVRTLCQEKSNLTLTDSKLVTPLLYASAFGSLEAMKVLLESGADVNAKDSFGQAPLHWAASDPHRVKLLIEHGADVNARTKNGRTALMAASASPGAEESVRLLLHKGADVNPAQEIGTTALMEAGLYGGTRIAKMLLSAGAQADAADKGGYTPLMYAAGSGNVELTRLLLSKGANVNAKNTYSGTVKYGDIQLKSLTALMLAVPTGSVELVQVLLDAGADVKARDLRGMTALMMAAGSEIQNPRAVELLIERGSDVNAVSETGESVLDWARKFNEPEVLALLERKGAKGSRVEEAPVRKADAATDVRASAALSTALVQRISQSFWKQSGCVGCHHQPQMTMVVKAAKEHGIEVDVKDLAEQRRAMAVRMSLQDARPLLLEQTGGGLTQLSQGLAGLMSAGHEADFLTDSIVFQIAAQQQLDGHWTDGHATSRAPMEESEITTTAYSAMVLRHYAIPSRKAEFEERIARARAWMLAARPRHTYERADLLIGLKSSGASQEQLKRVATALANEQRADGGWAQRSTLASDAYATGLAMRALRMSGQPGLETVFRKGVEFLMKTQLEDGTWYVRSRGMKLQPYFQSGFPYEHDQWISYSATALATAALLESLPGH